MKRCKVDGCDKVHSAHGYCGMHYMRIYRNGKLDKVRTPNDEKDLYDQIEPVPESGCWIWLGKTNKQGYGELRMSTVGFGDIRATHRISYLLHKGEIGEGLFVCHKCDIPSCVNPEHLFLGTAKDNAQDAVQKGRRPKHPTWNAKLTEKDVLKIRGDHRPIKEIAQEYGVTRGCISHVISGLTWSHI